MRTVTAVGGQAIGAMGRKMRHKAPILTGIDPAGENFPG